MRALSTTAAVAIIISITAGAGAVRIHVPTDYTTIQAAIDAASASGDSVLVSPGTYDERVNFKGKAVVVRAESGPESTVIDGRGIEPCVVMWSGEDAGAVLDGFTLTRGWNVDGGGLHLNGASPTLKNLLVTDCSAEAAGGGLYALSGAQPLVEDCTFLLCSAGDYGAAIASYRSAPWLERCVMANNSATTAGGGIWASRGSPTVVSCTFDQNSAGVGGHAAFLDSADVVFTNSIVVQSASSGIWADETALIDATYNNVWANGTDYVNVSPGQGSISVDPRFVPDGYDLDSESPCIDAGNPADPPPAGGGARIDIGAHEYDYQTRVVDVLPGQSIQAAIDTALAGDLIRVAPGTYHENLDLMGKLVTLESTEGPEATVIDGGDSSSVIWVHRGENASTRIQGFTLRNGHNTRGGGLLIEYSSPTISNLIIEDCESDADGGGIYVRNWCEPAIEDVVLRNNISGQFGGGLACYRASPTVARSVIHDNVAVSHGGGIFVRESDAIVMHCSIAYNSGGNGPGGTGGIYVDKVGSPQIHDNIISHSGKGAGIRVVAPATPILSHNCSWAHDGDDYAGISAGPGSISEDPLFIDAPAYNFHLSSPAGHFEEGVLVDRTPGALSGCIDSGDPLLDVGAEPIPNGGRRNLGAFGGTCDASRTPGERFDVPFDYASIAEAMTDAADGDTIHIGSYTAHESVVIAGIMVSLIGDGIGTSIIDGDHSRRCLTISDINPGTVEISGITFREGNGDGGDGGAILLDDASPSMRDCEIVDSSARWGGGMLISRGAPDLSNLTFHGNIATEAGGALAYNEGASGELFRSLLWSNAADSMGGAVYVVDSSPTLLNCTIDDNSCGLLGAGGGVHVDENSLAEVRNCSISNTSFGIGVYGKPGAITFVTYSNGFGNAPGGDWRGFIFGDRATRKSYAPGYTLADPYYGLRPNSRLIDAGSPADPVPEGGGDRVDIGAHEFLQRLGQVVIVPDDYATIAEAIAGVDEGDTVLVLEGTYPERLIMSGVGVNLVADADGGDVVITASDPGLEGDPLLWIDGVIDGAATISGFVFEGGRSEMGGALLLDNCDVLVTDCTFRSNLATYGGAVAAIGGASRIDGCRLIANEANDGGGGGIYVAGDSGLRMSNSLIAENYTNRDGGGIFVGDGLPEFINLTVAANHATARGAGLFLGGSSYAAIQNTIVASNTGAHGIYAEAGAGAELRRDNVWGHEPQDYEGLQPGGGDMSENPLFVGGTTFDYHLQSSSGSWHDDVEEFVFDLASSPCIDRGINPDGDPLVEPVPNGGLINLGFSGNTLLASMSSSQVLDVPSGEFPTIQSAIDAAVDGDQVLVAPGTYTGPFQFGGTDVVMVARGGPDSTALVTSIGSPVLTIANGETNLATVDGFRFEGNTADLGAAILMINASPTISNCHFIDNMATLDGGGAIAMSRGAARIMNNTFIGNHAPLDGGALMAVDAAVLLKGNSFQANTSDYAGGALAIIRDGTDPAGPASVFENEFLLNEATGAGGGAIFVVGATPSIRRNHFRDNSTPFHGGGLYATGDGLGGTLHANFFIGNEATDIANDSRGGAVALRYASNGRMVIANNTLVSNLADQGSGIMVQSATGIIANNILTKGRTGIAVEVRDAEPALLYNDFWENEAGMVAGMPIDSTNMALDPEFADTSYTLSPGSAMIDAAHPVSNLDHDGSRADLGASQFTHTLELTVVPDSSWIQAGETFGMLVDVTNPDLQIQGPILRETLVTMPDNGSQFVANSDTLMVLGLGTDSARVEGPVSSRAPAGVYRIRVSISVAGAIYDEHEFDLEILRGP